MADISITEPRFGGIEGAPDNTAAFIRALEFADGQDYKPDIGVPPGIWNLKAPLPLFDGLSLIGAHTERGRGRRRIISNAVTTMFEFPGRPVADVTLAGVAFKGDGAKSGTYCFDPADDIYSLDYSNIERCGFSFFQSALHLRLGGTTISKSWVNNCADTPVRLSGWDAAFEDTFVDSDIGDRPMVHLVGMLASRAADTFITHSRGGIPLFVEGGDGIQIVTNRLDGFAAGQPGASGAGLYVKNANDVGIVGANRIHKTMRNPAASAGSIVLDNSSHVTIDGPIFKDVPAGAATLAFAGACDDIAMRGAVYDNATPKFVVLPGGSTPTNWRCDEFVNKAHAGAINDSVYPGVVPDGTIGTDTRRQRIYARVGGRWKSAGVS